MWIAEEKGFFKKYDIETEAIVIGGGATRSLSAVIAGDLQFGSTGGGAVVSAVFSGADIAMVAAGNNKGIQRLMVKADITLPAALKGKRIGITAIGIFQPSGTNADAAQMEYGAGRCPDHSGRSIAGDAHQFAKGRHRRGGVARPDIFHGRRHWV